MRKHNFVQGEYYHIYNRGVDKRDIFVDRQDVARFFQSIAMFNTIEPIGSIYENSFLKEEMTKPKLVDFVCYCLNQNHYHFLLTPLVEKGIEKFMHKLNTGYTRYFNNKYKRTGSLCGSRFKSKYIDSNEYLLHVSAYINLNDQLGGWTTKLSGHSSWQEYCLGNEAERSFCKKDIILEQFKTIEKYKEFALNSFLDIQRRKKLEKDMIDE